MNQLMYDVIFCTLNNLQAADEVWATVHLIQKPSQLRVYMGNITEYDTEKPQQCNNCSL